MRIIRDGGYIWMRDQPAPFWSLGLFLLFGAGLAIAMPLGLASNAMDLAGWERNASVAVGLGVGAGALWWLIRNPATLVTIDLTRRRLTLMRLGLLGRQVRRIQLGEIVGVDMERGPDSDGGSVWRPLIRLSSGERMMLSELWNHDEKAVKEGLAVLAEACRLPRPGHVTSQPSGHAAGL
jgi:hypothetical protein